MQNRIYKLLDENNSSTMPRMRRLPPLNSLRAFEAAARHMSFADAAAELGVTPTAISHQVKLLEEICGCLLFRRRPRPMRLTEAGQTLLPVLRRGFDDFAAAMNGLTQANARRPLVMTATTAFAARWLLPRLAEWYAVNPEPPLEVRASEEVHDLKRGDIDFAVRYSRHAPTDASAFRLYQDQLQPVLSPSLRTRLALSGNPACLLDVPLIHFEWKSRDPDAPQWQDWFAAAGQPDAMAAIGQDKLIHVSDENQAIEMALAGRGAALIGHAFVRRELDNGLLERPFGTTVPSYSFWIVYDADNGRVPLIETFANWAGTLLDQEEVAPSLTASNIIDK
ncbi:LysR substrate-binding domain-containing protein [Pararhizobium sp. IMCC21322]|uniref:LysR substrate-binding domain-containing protein n=1 Tax=Pararhizobium sp. IMCC21322 TaxID=3067903 RepID=UPI002741AB51|nr:LysR substrate-binding domain-containing protein [Pararhizobium sp. IMCC21322]